jgi:hypothetical protein
MDSKLPFDGRFHRLTDESDVEIAVARNKRDVLIRNGDHPEDSTVRLTFDELRDIFRS